MNCRRAVMCSFLFSSMFVFISSCKTESSYGDINYRSEMRGFVEKISLYGKTENKNFIIIPQNGQELLSYDGEASGKPVSSYINAIDGVGREDLFYGYTGDDIETPPDALNYMLPYLELAEREGVEVLTIDYCSTESKMDRSYRENRQRGFISLSADSRGLDSIPAYPPIPSDLNSRDIRSLPEASNFLYLINPERFPSREKMIEEVVKTSYDLLIIDLFDNDGIQLTENDVARFQRKSNGGSRLVIAYMSIGEAEEYRYYWHDAWNSSPPQWLERENPHWKGNYKVKYWEPSWQNLIMGEKDSYLDLILQTGFDGVYLDIIDAFEYFE